MSKAQRNVIRGARFTAQEWDLLRSRARECGLPPSTYLRRVSLKAIPRARPHQLERDAIYHLGRIGNNLNQLTHLANAMKRVELSARLEQTLADLRAALKRLAR